MHDPYHNIQPLHQVSFVYSSFHHKINTGNDGDKDENNGGIQPALNQACFSRNASSVSFLLTACTLYVITISMTRMAENDMSSKAGIIYLSQRRKDVFIPIGKAAFLCETNPQSRKLF